MAEPKTLRTTVLRRGVAPKGTTGPSWIVFAPLPISSPTLGAAVEVLACLKASPVDRERVLWLGDWSAFCAGCMVDGKSAKDGLAAISSWFDIFVAALRAIAPQEMEDVSVLKQSDVILANPNDYWISVINAGTCVRIKPETSYRP